LDFGGRLMEWMTHTWTCSACGKRVTVEAEDPGDVSAVIVQCPCGRSEIIDLEWSNDLP
jgi:uncharacterized protein (DUF983 family)